MNGEQAWELSQCSEFRQTLLAKPPRVIRATLVLLGALVMTAVLWSVFTEADLVVRASGRVRPMTQEAQNPDAAAEESEISSLRGGRVSEVHVREGDQVRKGDLLIRLETERLDNDIAKQRQLIEAGEKELARINHTETNLQQRFQTADAKAEAELAQAKHAVQEAKQRRDAAIRLAEVELELAQDEMRRCQELAGRLAVSEAEVVLAEGRARIAAIELERARLPVDEGRVLVLQHALQLVQKDYAVDLAKLDNERELKKDEVATAQLEMARLEWERQQSELSAPSDGTITALAVKVGDVVEAGRALLDLAEQHGFRIEAAVTSEDVGQLRVGMPARIKMDAYDYQKYGTMTGRVVFVSPDSTLRSNTPGPPVYAVRIALDGDYVGKAAQRGQVKLGMTGVAEIVTDRESLFLLLLHSIRQSISLG